MVNSVNAPNLIKEGQKLRQGGDEEGARKNFLEAGQELYDRHRDRMLARCTWKFGDTGDAGKDVVQNIFQLLWVKMPELEHPEAVEGWLYGALDNKMLQMERDMRRRGTILEEKRRPIAESVHRDLVDTPDNIAMREEEDQERKNILILLSQALKKLNPEDEILLKMRFRLNLSLVAIGSAVGVSEATVRRRIGNLLGILNEELQKQRRAS